MYDKQVTISPSTVPSDSESLVARAVRVIPGGVNSIQRRIAGMKEIVVTATKGSTFTAADGRIFTDYAAAYGPPILGYNDPDVDAAVASTASSVGLVGVGVTVQEVELAERLCDLIPAAERVLLCGSGSEATYHAIRLARAATGRRHIIKFQGHYHGWHDAVAMNVISPEHAIGTKHLLSSGMMPNTVAATTVLPFNDLDSVARALDELDNDVAAVILEPIPHNVGAILPEEGYLEGLRDLTRRTGVVLIFDEVVTGFRHGLGGYQSVAGVTPDIAAFGKAIANGYPLACVVGNAEIMDMAATSGGPVFIGGTFNGHPAMAAAAVATVDKMVNEPVHEHVFDLGERARSGLQAIYDRLGVAAVVTGFGSLFVSYFLEGPIRNYTDLLRNDVELFVGHRLELMEHGIFEVPLNLKRSQFSYAHSEADLERLLDASEQAMVAVLTRRGE